MENNTVKRRSKRQLARIFRTAAKLIDRYHGIWCQGSVNGEELEGCGTRACAFGLLHMAELSLRHKKFLGQGNYPRRPDDFEEAFDAAVTGTGFVRDIGAGSPIIRFNDCPDASAEAVKRGFRKTARYLEHGGKFNHD